MQSACKICLASTIAALTMLFTTSCAQTTPPQIDKLWEEATFSIAQDIIHTYKGIQEQIDKKDKDSATKNKCHLIWAGGEYTIRCKGNDPSINLLAEYIDTLSFDDAIVQQFTQSRDIAKFADYYYMLRAINRGESFDEARDGLTATVFFPIRPLNNNDYIKLHEVFSYKNNKLHEAYLEKMKFQFGNSGCSQGFYSVKHLIESNVTDSELKRDILQLYEKYIPIMDGAPAPQVQLKDKDGKTYTFDTFRGKVLVIDIWATWCSSCLAKMPEYMKLRDEFADNKEVEFITISIDRKSKRKLWLSSIKKHSMEEMINLTTDDDNYSGFEDKYNIVSVPRYMIIDKDGKIVNAFAPAAGENMKRLIIENLNK